MKKLICFLLVLTMLAGMSALASADGEMWIILTPDLDEAYKGDEVRIEVELMNNPGLAGMEFGVNYDKDVLEWTNVLQGEDFPGNWDTALNDTVTKVTWYNNTDANNTKDSVFCTLVFKVKNDAKLGETKVSLVFEDEAVYKWAGDDNHEEDVAFEAYEAELTVIMKDGFYLIGQNGWTEDSIDWLQKFEPNPENTNEYMLTTELIAGKPVKVVYVAGNTISAWYPNGTGNEYVVEEKYGKNVTIFFNPNGNDSDDWKHFGGFIYISDGVVKPDKSADVYGCSVSMKGDIGLNIFLILSEDLLADEGAYVTLGGQKFIIKDAPTRIVGDDTLYQFTMHKAAKEMNDEVELKLFDGEGNQLSLFRHSQGGIVPQTGFSYSVQTYIGKSLANPKSSDALKALMNAMSDYGRTAQLYFNYNTGKLAPLSCDLDTVTADLLADFEINITGTLNANVAASLDLDSEVKIKVGFVMPKKDTYTFSVDGKQVAELSTKTYTVEIPNIVAKDLDRTYTIEVKNSAGDVKTVKYSALSYAYTTLSKDDSSDTLQDLVKAMYLYNKAANEYFGG